MKKSTLVIDDPGGRSNTDDMTDDGFLVPSQITNNINHYFSFYSHQPSSLSKPFLLSLLLRSRGGRRRAALCEDCVDSSLRSLEALSGSLCVPPHRHGTALIHTLTKLPHDTHSILSLCVSLLRRLLVPLDRLLVVMFSLFFPAMQPRICD